MGIYTQSINEIYLGKEAIAPLFNQFVLVRKEIKNAHWNPKINTNKEIIKFNRLAEQFFGFDIFALVFVPNEDMNASSLVFASVMDKDELNKISNALKAGKTGFKFDKEKAKVDATITCNMGLIDRDLYTDEEVFAIFLHEFGHCFFSAVEDRDSIFTYNYYMTNACKSVTKTAKEVIIKKIPITRETISKGIKTILSLNPIKKIDKFFNLTGRIRYVSNKIRKFFKEDNSMNMKKEVYSYSGEKFADTFATSYGYGPELHSAFLKDTKDYMKFDYKNGYKEYAKKKFAFMNYIKLNKLLSEAYQDYIDNVADEHPNEMLRVNISIQYIRRELAKENLDPKLKLQLVSQLNELQKLIDDYNDNSGNDDYMYILKEYYKELNRQYNGDPREKDVDNDALFDTMDQRYNDLIKK